MLDHDTEHDKHLNEPTAASSPVIVEDVTDGQSFAVPNDDDDELPGAIQISDDVIGVIAGMAASEVEGVAGMSGGLVGGISEMLGKRNLSKGVKVEVRNNKAQLSLYMSVLYGMRIPRVAQMVQEKVKVAVESMTGLTVTHVNIHIQGVTFPGEERTVEPRAQS